MTREKLHSAAVTLDGVLTHPAVKLLLYALVSLAAFVVNGTLGDVKTLAQEQQRSTAAIKDDLAAYKTQATTEVIRLSARVDGIEYRVSAVERSSTERRQAWDAAFGQFLESVDQWKRDEQRARTKRSAERDQAD